MTQAFSSRQKLIESILAFDIDGGTVKLSFAKRLARENQWSLEYAERVIQEYKKFVALAMVSNKQVTPSEDVDQAWHLHLCYTVSYWERLHQLLPFPLHHHPTQGGQSEGLKFEDQYDSTLDLYREVFGEAPPADIWPGSETRFGRDLRWAKISLSDNVVLPKRTLRRIALAAGSIAAAFTATGCMLAASQTPSVDGEFIFLAALGGLGAITLVAVIFKAATRYGKGDGRSDGSSGCGAGGCGGGSHGDSSSSDGSADSGSDGGSDGSGGCGGGGCGGGGCGGGGN